MTNKMKHPNSLRHYRLKRHLTQQAVANHVGHKSANRLSAWENGQARPSLHNLMKLSHLYGVPAEKLYAPLSRRRARTAKVIGTKRSEKSDNVSPSHESNESELIAYLAEIIVDAYLSRGEQK